MAETDAELTRLGKKHEFHAYDGAAPPLAAQGWRVLVPYLRGYGPTRFLSPDTPRSGEQAAHALDSALHGLFSQAQLELQYRARHLPRDDEHVKAHDRLKRRVLEGQRQSLKLRDEFRKSGVEYRVVPSLCPSATSPFDFTRAAELIELAEQQTISWLRASPASW